MEKSFFNAVYQVVKQIPKGKVATYGDIANLTGNPKMSKFVGFALHQNKSQFEVPCYKIVDRLGRLSKAYVFGGEDVQKTLLEKDGIKVENGKVDLNIYRITADVIKEKF